MLTSAQLSNVATSVFAANADAAITTIIFCNTDQNSAHSPALVNVWAVPNGNVVGTGTQVICNLSLPPTETFVMDTEKLILSTGDAVFASASVTATVCVTVSSVSI